MRSPSRTTYEKSTDDPVDHDQFDLGVGHSAALDEILDAARDDEGALHRFVLQSRAEDGRSARRRSGGERGSPHPHRNLAAMTRWRTGVRWVIIRSCPFPNGWSRWRRRSRRSASPGRSGSSSASSTASACSLSGRGAEVRLFSRNRLAAKLSPVAAAIAKLARRGRDSRWRADLGRAPGRPTTSSMFCGSTGAT